MPKTKAVICLCRCCFPKGFTLIELLVAVLIIGILGAIAVPQYQKAVMKSRFAAMMPIAKTLANANEVYYAEHDEYSTDPAKLNVTPQAGTPDGTAINMYSNPEEVSFVRVENPSVPNARYVVYQKLSENFPETTWCEAGDTRAEELCQTLGGTLPDGLTGNSSGDNTNYKAYLLTGLARSGDTFAETEPQTPTCEGVSCDEEGNITECASGKTLNNGLCEDCATAFPGASTCSTTAYKPTACSEGYTLNTAGTACVSAPLIPARAAVKDGYPKCDTSSSWTQCNYQYEGKGITITYDMPTLLGSLDCKGDPFQCSSSYTSSSDGGSLVQYNSGQGYYFELYYDKNGVFNGGLVTISGHQKNYYFDAAGNLIGAHSTTFVPGYSWEVYDSNGNMRSLQDSSWTYYSYNEDGSFDRATQGGQTVSVTPTVTDVRDYKISETELAQARVYGPSLVGQTKCELFPELQGC